MKWIAFIGLAFWIVCTLYIGQADVQCHLGHVPWPLEGC